MDDTDERFARALHGATRAWRQAIDRRLKGLGLSEASWMTLAVAAKAQQALSQSELAERLAVEGATLVAMVDRLVRAGLVTREPSLRDRRIKHVVLTASGRELYAEGRARAAVVRTELLSGIDAAALAGATHLLETLRGRSESVS